MTFSANSVYRFHYLNSNPTKNRIVLVQRVDKDRITGVELDTGDVKQFLTTFISNLKQEKHAELPREALGYAEVIFAKMLGCHADDVETCEVNDKVYGWAAPREPLIKAGISGNATCLNPDNGKKSVSLSTATLYSNVLLVDGKQMTASEFIDYLRKVWL